MVEKVTLWRASNGDHFNTQEEAAKAEAYDEFADLLERHGLATSVIPALMSAALENHGSIARKQGSEIIHTFINATRSAEAARKAALSKNTPKGERVDDPGPGTYERPRPLPVQAPVRRRAIGNAVVQPAGDTRPPVAHVEDLHTELVEMETPMAMHGNEMLPSGPDRPARRNWSDKDETGIRSGR